MTQLILDTTGYNLVLPESVKGGYVVEEQALSVDVEMITGRIVRQLRGNAWHITYQYGLFDDDTKNKLISVCRKGKGQAITCGFLRIPLGHYSIRAFLSWLLHILNLCGVGWCQEKTRILSDRFGGTFLWNCER